MKTILNTKKILSVAILLSLHLTSQNCFTSFLYSSSSETITFNNLSTGDNSHFYWNFGDGTTSFVKNPTHVFPENGSYLTTLFIKETITGATSFYDAWIDIEKPSQEVCSPSINDSIFYQNGNTFIKIIDSSVSCLNYVANYDVALFSGPMDNLRQIPSYPSNLIAAAYYTINNVTKRAAYKTCPNNVSLHYTTCNNLTGNSLYNSDFLVSGNFVKVSSNHL